MLVETDKYKETFYEGFRKSGEKIKTLRNFERR